MTIWADPLTIGWSDDERAELAGIAAAPAPDRGAAGRRAWPPEGAGESTSVLGVWTYDVEPVEPTFPPDFDPVTPEVVLRGMARMIPAMAAYVERLPRCFVDGGVLHQDAREPLPLVSRCPSRAPTSSAPSPAMA
jgi:hypothetical protein